MSVFHVLYMSHSIQIGFRKCASIDFSLLLSGFTRVNNYSLGIAQLLGNVYKREGKCKRFSEHYTKNCGRKRALFNRHNSHKGIFDFGF